MSHRDIESDWTVAANGAWFGVMKNAPKKPAPPVSPETIAAEISRLSGLPLKKLKAAWSAEVRREVPKSMWRLLLLRTLAWRLQEKAFGGHEPIIDRDTFEAVQASLAANAITRRPAQRPRTSF
jgi:hypothetical protein